jgi:hypothetical protein
VFIMKLLVKIELPITMYIDIYTFKQKVPKKKMSLCHKSEHSTLHLPQVYVLMVPLEYESNYGIIYVEVSQKSNFYKSL